MPNAWFLIRVTVQTSASRPVLDAPTAELLYGKIDVSLGVFVCNGYWVTVACFHTLRARFPARSVRTAGFPGYAKSRWECDTRDAGIPDACRGPQTVFSAWNRPTPRFHSAA